MKVPAFRRVEELDNPSAGWPSLGAERGRKWRGVLVRISIYLTVMTLVVSVIGFRAVLADYYASFTFPIWDLAKAWGQLLSGGVFLLLLEGWVAYCAFWGKRVPWVLVVFAWIGVYGMLWSASDNYHDISHAMFESCMGYSDFVVETAAGIACLITAVWLLEFRMLRGTGYDMVRMYRDWEVSRNQKRIFGLLGIGVCWLGTLWFYDVI